MDTNEGESHSADQPATSPNRPSEVEGLRHLLMFLEGNLLKMFEAGPPADLAENADVSWTDEEHLFVNLRLPGRHGPDIDISFHADTCSVRVQF